MSIVTKGILHHQDAEIPVLFNENEDFQFVQINDSSLKIILIKNGSIIYRVNNKRIAMSAPCLLCFNEKDKIEIEQQDNILAEAFYFHPNYINNRFTYEDVWQLSQKLHSFEYQDLYWFGAFVEKSEEYQGQIPVGPNSFNRLSELFDKCKNQLLIQPDIFWPCRSRSYFLEIFFLLDKIKNANLVKPILALDEKNEKISQVILYIHTNYMEKISIESLTNRFQINRTTLSSLFKNSTNQTIMEYISQLRLNLAAILLRDTYIPISEIVSKVGFKSVTYFERLFSKHWSISPTQYRNDNCWVIK